MQQTRGAFCTTRRRLRELLPAKAGMLALAVGAMLAVHDRGYAESVGQPAGKTPEVVHKVSKELDQGGRASDSEKIIAVADVLLGGGGTLPFISAQELFNQAIQTGGSAGFLLSIQEAADYRQGHVPGAVNIPYTSLAKQGSLAKIPRDRKVVVIDDDGHRANAAAFFLNQLGYEASAMVMGMGAWNAASPGLGRRQPYAGSAGYAVSTESTLPAAVAHELPVVTTGQQTVASILIARTDAYLSSRQPLEITPREVYEKVVKGGDPGYFLLSIQRPEEYRKGHVPGTVNIPCSEIAKHESLAKLPRDKKIVVVCYIGHFGGAVALLLNQLGYEAYDMQYGTMGWNDTTEGLGPRKQYIAAMLRSQGYPTTAGSRP